MVTFTTSLVSTFQVTIIYLFGNDDFDTHSVDQEKLLSIGFRLVSGDIFLRLKLRISIQLNGRSIFLKFA